MPSCANVRCPTRRMGDADVCDVGGLRLAVCLPLARFGFVTRRGYNKILDDVFSSGSIYNSTVATVANINSGNCRTMLHHATADQDASCMCGGLANSRVPARHVILGSHAVLLPQVTSPHHLPPPHSKVHVACTSIVDTYLLHPSRVPFCLSAA